MLENLPLCLSIFYLHVKMYVIENRGRRGWVSILNPIKMLPINAHYCDKFKLDFFLKGKAQ